MIFFEYGDSVRVLKGPHKGQVGIIINLCHGSPFYEVVIHDFELGGPTGILLRPTEMEKVVKCEDPRQQSLF